MAEPHSAEMTETAGSDGAPSDAANDAALVELARSGDEDAYALLVARYERQVRIYLAHLIGDDAHANDLTQEVSLNRFSCLSLRCEAGGTPALHSTGQAICGNLFHTRFAWVVAG